MGGLEYFELAVSAAGESSRVSSSPSPAFGLATGHAAGPEAITVSRGALFDYRQPAASVQVIGPAADGARWPLCDRRNDEAWNEPSD